MFRIVFHCLSKVLDKEKSRKFASLYFSIYDAFQHFFCREDGLAPFCGRDRHLSDEAVREKVWGIYGELWPNRYEIIRLQSSRCCPVSQPNGFMSMNLATMNVYRMTEQVAIALE